MTTGKTIALNIWTFVGKVMSLLFNMLPRLVIASSVYWSLQCLISALTQRGRWWTLFFFFFRLTDSVTLWEERDTANK